MNKKELITKENVKTMGEVIAVACARNRCAMYYTERAKKLYDGLVRDVYHHNGDPAQTFSEGYDLAMEAIAFLCEHIGKRLSDTTTVLKYGNPKKMTILQGCFFVVGQYITKQVTYDKKSANIDDPKVMEMDECIFIPMETEDTNDWDKVDEIIIKLQLTPEEIQLLDYRMSGKSYPEIGRLVGCANSTARARLLRIGKRYIDIQ